MKDFKRLLTYLRPHVFTFIVATVAMIFVALFETAIGALIVPIFDQAFNSGAGKASSTLFNLQNLIPKEDWFKSWAIISGLLLFFHLGSGVSQYISSYLMAKIGQSSILSLRQQLYDHLLKQSANFFQSHRTTFLVSRLVNSAAAIEMAVAHNLRDVLRESFNLVAFLAAAFYFNWRLMLGALIIAPVIGGLTTKFSKSLRRLAEETYEGNKLLTDTVQETISNLPIVKAYRGENREKSRFATVAGKIARANLRSGKIGAISPAVITMIGIFAVITLLFFGLREINSGRMEAPQFFTFLFFLFKSYDPMRKISRQHNEISKAFAAARDVWDVLDIDDELPEKPDAIELPALNRKIEIRDVYFKYLGDKRNVLRGIDLEIEKGSMVALVGESGGGKSSLIKLIQRLYDVSEGAIFWDGVDLRDARLSSLKKQIALVTQETVLFNDTISYNISYGKPDAGQDEIVEAARIAFADQFIRDLPEGYETLVGERGIFLSGGQRQRIAIARAVLVNAPVLILDEATSALDTESEQLVQKALNNLMEHRTSIVIAHRLSTVRRADKIVVLQKGLIVESGTHEELLALGGTYKRLYELQFAGEEALAG
ncbi:MAG: ABC transporter transmembrane domain-containing protein [Pyrinomonadaceae bacterium]